MKSKYILSSVILLIWMTMARAQQSTDPLRAYRNFPIVVGIQFQSVGLPFKNFASSFSNPGLRLGTEVSLTGRQSQDWAQGFTVGWNFNKNAGNNFTAFTQTMYRPTLVGNFFTDLRLGIGIMKNMHPTDAFTQVDGQWVNNGTSGKTTLVVPAGISFGYNGYHSGGSYFSPFISYEVMAAANYNRIVPVLPVSVFQVGTRMYLIGLPPRKQQ